MSTIASKFEDADKFENLGKKYVSTQWKKKFTIDNLFRLFCLNLCDEKKRSFITLLMPDCWSAARTEAEESPNHPVERLVLKLNFN